MTMAMMGSITTNGGSIVRTGMWTTEEQDFAYALIAAFHARRLGPEHDGHSLRKLLASKLRCSPKRISKKFEGTNYCGKSVYTLPKLAPVDEIEKTKQKLATLETHFLASVEEQDEMQASAAIKTMTGGRRWTASGITGSRASDLVHSNLPGGSLYLANIQNDGAAKALFALKTSSKLKAAVLPSVVGNHALFPSQGISSELTLEQRDRLMSHQRKESMMRNANATLALSSQSLALPLCMSRGGDALLGCGPLSGSSFFPNQQNLAYLALQQASMKIGNSGRNTLFPSLPGLSANSTTMGAAMSVGDYPARKRTSSTTYQDIRQRVDIMASKRAKLN